MALGFDPVITNLTGLQAQKILEQSWSSHARPALTDQPLSLGTINDMWFSWIIDIGFPGPDRGEGGKYLILPPGYDGPLPEGRFLRRQVENLPRALCRTGILDQQRSQTNR